MTLLHNPSHLEAVNPVSLGKTKAKQDDLASQEKVLNVQLHGDAAHAGQGIIYESLAIGKMPKYSVGGSIHIIVNNQIGNNYKRIRKLIKSKNYQYFIFSSKECSSLEWNVPCSHKTFYSCAYK